VTLLWRCDIYQVACKRRFVCKYNLNPRQIHSRGRLGFYVTSDWLVFCWRNDTATGVPWHRPPGAAVPNQHRRRFGGLYAALRLLLPVHPRPRRRLCCDGQMVPKDVFQICNFPYLIACSHHPCSHVGFQAPIPCLRSRSVRWLTGCQSDSPRSRFPPPPCPVSLH